MSRPARDQKGSITPLMVGFSVMVILLVAVVADASALFIRRQGLANLVDGAALHGADAGARVSQQQGFGADRMPQTEAAVAAGVRQYLRQVGAEDDYGNLQVTTSLARDGRTVRVKITGTVALPLHFPGAPMRSQVSAQGAAALRIQR